MWYCGTVRHEVGARVGRGGPLCYDWRGREKEACSVVSRPTFHAVGSEPSSRWSTVVDA
jgi:hypothetical protein